MNLDRVHVVERLRGLHLLHRDTAFLREQWSVNERHWLVNDGRERALQAGERQGAGVFLRDAPEGLEAQALDTATRQSDRDTAEPFGETEVGPDPFGDVCADVHVHSVGNEVASEGQKD